jgi:polyphosphate kinase
MAPSTAAAPAQGLTKAKRSEPLTSPSLDQPGLYLNRELSLLAFQRRVLEEAQDSTNPLLERIKFLSIVGSNLDEFFMVRVAGLKRQVERGVMDCGPDGMIPAAQLEAIHRNVMGLLLEAHECLDKQLLPALNEAGIRVLDYARLSRQQKLVANRYFSQTVFPSLTPLAVDPGRPFPHISNLSLNIAVLVRDRKGIEHFARLKIPSSLPQLVPLDGADRAGKGRIYECFLWLEQLVMANLAVLFPGMKIVEAHPFHVTRDADTDIQELTAGDLLESVEEGVWQRRFADVVRLEVDTAMPHSVLDILVSNFEIDRHAIYRLPGPLGLTRIRHLCTLNRPELKDRPFAPALPTGLAPQENDEDIFAAIRRRDVLLHHPYESFQPVVAFFRQAARDPAVLAIKTTLYRVGRNAPVVEALLEAIRNGKQVAVVVELKARFDEESNIEWARVLEREGVHVVYGLVGLKVHSKTTLVVRQEGDVIRRYVHLSTGNYNTVTAQLYTDIGMFSCDRDLGEDCTDLFNYLTGYSAKTKFRKLLVAPINLRQKFEELVRREMRHQREGRQGHLIFKMNALVDKRMIRLLYEASQSGVRIDLLVRGICLLRPGIRRVSDKIRVISIVGRFLEHSRAFYFRNGGEEEVYLGSADLMPRNLNRRVEVLFPVQDSRIIRYLRDEVLATYLADVVKARYMRSNGTYMRSRSRNAENALEGQRYFIERAVRRQAEPLPEAPKIVKQPRLISQVLPG